LFRKALREDSLEAEDWAAEALAGQPVERKQEPQKNIGGIF
jgi:hypothetical protein